MGAWRSAIRRRPTASDSARRQHRGGDELTADYAFDPPIGFLVKAQTSELVQVNAWRKDMAVADYFFRLLKRIRDN